MTSYGIKSCNRGYFILRLNLYTKKKNKEIKNIYVHIIIFFAKGVDFGKFLLELGAQSVYMHYSSCPNVRCKYYLKYFRLRGVAPKQKWHNFVVATSRKHFPRNSIIQHTRPFNREDVYKSLVLKYHAIVLLWVLLLNNVRIRYSFKSVVLVLPAVFTVCLHMCL